MNRDTRGHRIFFKSNKLRRVVACKICVRKKFTCKMSFLAAGERCNITNIGYCAMRDTSVDGP